MINSTGSVSGYSRPDNSSPIFQSPNSITDFGTVQAPEMAKIALGSTQNNQTNNLSVWVEAAADAYKAYTLVGGGPQGVVAAAVVGVRKLFGRLFGGKKRKRQQQQNQGVGNNANGPISLLLKVLQGGDQKIK